MELRDFQRFVAAALVLLLLDLALTAIWRGHQTYSATNAVFAVGYVILRAIREPHP
jgi:hypothetical protein